MCDYLGTVHLLAHQNFNSTPHPTFLTKLSFLNLHQSGVIHRYSLPLNHLNLLSLDLSLQIALIETILKLSCFLRCFIKIYSIYESVITPAYRILKLHPVYFVSIIFQEKRDLWNQEISSWYRYNGFQVKINENGWYSKNMNASIFVLFVRRP